MFSTQTCAKCGTPLPVDAPPGVCPKCALSAALHARPEDPADETGGGRLEDRETASQAPPADPAEPRAQCFGDYELLEEIARGGMGIVYRARQISLDRIVAVKLLPFSSLTTTEFIKRFRAEASAAAALRHPNIVTVHEVGVFQGQHYLVMNFVNGPPLGRLVADGPLPVRRAATYMKLIAEAVHYSHEQGILHRDLKPSNVLIDENDQPQVTDFGLAKRLDGESSLTLTGQALGSPGYMPPEQASAEHSKVTRRSDVYGLGAMMYHLLTGRPPFQASTLNQAIHQVVDTEPLAPNLLNPDLPLDLQTICLKCLEKEPERRYPTAQEVAEELGRFLNGEPIQARRIGAIGKTWRWSRRRPVLAGLSAALILTFIAGLTGVVWQWRRAEAGERLAQLNAYAADIKLAQQSIEKGDLGTALSLLNKYQPARSGSTRWQRSAEDMRGWEWRYLWQLCQSDEQSTLRRYASWVGGVVVATDLDLLAVQRGDGLIALWDLSGRREITNLAAAGNRGTLDYSPAGNLLAAANIQADGQAEVRFWNLKTLSLITTVPQEAPVISLSLSTDGRYLAIRDSRDIIIVWEIASWKSLARFEAQNVGGWTIENWSSGRLLQFSPDGTLLAFRDGRDRIRVMDWRAGTDSVPPIVSPSTEPVDNLMLNQVTALAFSPDGRLLIWGHGSGAIYLWDLVQGNAAGRLDGHNNWVMGMAFSPDGHHLASASVDQTIRVWDLDARTELRCLRGSEHAVLSVDYLPDRGMLVSGGKDGSVLIWNAFKPEADSPNRVLPFIMGAYTPDGTQFVVLGSPHDTLSLWDVRSLQQVETLTEFGTNNHVFSLSRDGKWLAVNNRADPTRIRVVAWPSRKEATNLFVPSRPFGLNFSPDSLELLADYRVEGAPGLTVAEARETKVWRAGSWVEAPTPNIPLKPHVSTGQLSYDGHLVAVGYETGQIEIRIARTGQLVASLSGFSSRVQGVAFSLDGRMLAAAGLDEFVKVWEVNGGRELMTLRSDTTYNFSICFLPDGRRLAVGGIGGDNLEHRVQLWDLASQRVLLELPGGYANVAFPPRGDALLVVDTKEFVSHWFRAPSWEEIEAKESAASLR